MLTEITIRNFKNFPEVTFELGDRAVFVGPNNSGKTSALQALALWDIGLKRWIEKHGTGSGPAKRPGVTINRRDLIAVPIPGAKLLWRQLHVRRGSKTKDGKKGTQNVRIDIIVKGVTGDEEWACGLEFDYANEESFVCRPLRMSEDAESDRMEVPNEATNLQVSYLQPMSGLAATETRLETGAINVRLGEGRTAEVLRNLCYQILEGVDGEKRWADLCKQISHFFGIELQEPVYITERSEITLAYKDADGVTLDISSSGRGLQQTLLLLAHMMVNRGSVLLLDEPDAHLEILRQRQIYQLLTETARSYSNQLIAASHSEVILNEAADRDLVIAFVGKPHRIDDRGSQVMKALKEIGFDQYYQAETTGWVLYLEGSTDLAILRAFAEQLEHPAAEHLERPFVHYVANDTKGAQSHFHGLREAKSDLVGIAIYDRLERDLPNDGILRQRVWKRRELENYLCSRDVLRAWARDKGSQDGDLFAAGWATAMEEAIGDVEQALETLNKPSPWGPDCKVTDDFLDSLFPKFFKKLKIPNLMRKTDYHELARFVPAGAIDADITEKLDAVVETAEAAHVGPKESD